MDIDWRDLNFSHVVLGTVGAELTSFLPVKGLGRTGNLGGGLVGGDENTRLSRGLGNYHWSWGFI